MFDLSWGTTVIEHVLAKSPNSLLVKALPRRSGKTTLLKLIALDFPNTLVISYTHDPTNGAYATNTIFYPGTNYIIPKVPHLNASPYRMLISDLSSGSYVWNHIEYVLFDDVKGLTISADRYTFPKFDEFLSTRTSVCLYTP